MGNSERKRYKYSIGEYVTYRKVGVCRVEDMTVQNFGGQGKSEYYVLVSVYDSNTKVFVPVESELEAEMKKMLTVEEIHAVIDESKNVENMWVDDCRSRAKVFEEIVNSGDKAKMLWLIRTVSEYKIEMENSKKKMKAYDTRYLGMAEALISADFAYSLNLQKNQVMDYINKYLAK